VAGQRFKWHGLSNVDRKGRLSVPAAYRQTIEARGGGRDIMMSRHPSAPCIVCYDRASEDEVDLDLKEQKKIELERGDKTSFITRNRGIYMSSAEASWDPSGRVILPDYLRDRAGITDAALFVAFGDGFEIWDPQTALEQKQDEGLRDLAAYHLRKGPTK